MTTSKMRKLITVNSFRETGATIVVGYNVDGTPKNLIVDKQKDTELMEFVEGKVSQYDCINLCVAHEMEKHNKGFLDITKTDSLFESIANIARTHNNIHYGVKS